MVAKGLCQQCYNDLPENKARNVLTRRLRKYKLTDGQFQELLKKQNGKCPICGGEPTRVDHDHATGHVRGILCHDCNSGLGFFKDNTGCLSAAIEYLKRSHT